MSGAQNVMLGNNGAMSGLVPLSGTLTAANWATNNNGYSSVAPAGSITGNTLGNGRAVQEWYDILASAAVLTISGFSSDPGTTFFTTATYNGVAKTSASAAYSYSAGVARWDFGTTFSMGSFLGVSKNISIV
jgi:hypothetical protein